MSGNIRKSHGEVIAIIAEDLMVYSTFMIGDCMSGDSMTGYFFIGILNDHP